LGIELAALPQMCVVARQSTVTDLQVTETSFYCGYKKRDGNQVTEAYLQTERIIVTEEGLQTGTFIANI
jgi:hypothetical protein